MHIVRMGALFTVTVAALLAIILLGAGNTTPIAAPGIIHRSEPMAVIFTRPDHLEKLSAFIAEQRLAPSERPSREMAISVARRSLQMYLTTGNTRFLGAAKMAIAPWEDMARPPREIWILRGRLLQTDHRFEEAAQDLSLFNRVNFGSVEALLLEADAWRRAGLIANSRQACMNIAILGRMDLAKFCAAETLLSLGDADGALALVEPLMQYAATLPGPEKQWALAIYADVSLALGKPEQSAVYWARATQGSNVPLAYRLAYADVLLSLSRYEDVVELLNHDTAATASLLRIAVAAHSLGDDEAAAMQSALQRRLELGRIASSPDLHLREEALYTLWLEHDAEKSLQLALRNWELQKGWEDAALVLVIAEEIDNTAAVQHIRSWQQRNAGFEIL